MSINSGVNISKAVGYAVLEIPPGVDISKAVGFAVLENVFPPLWALSGFPAGMLNQPYSAGVDLVQGTGTITYTVTVGSLPPGLGISGTGMTCTLAGTPTTLGTFTFTIEASNTYGIADKAFSVTISAAVGVGGAFTFVS